jgi:nucleoside-diphosphate-sugar epimerase
LSELKVLLTGASGFVGSHVLDNLCSRRIRTAVLLRPGSSTRFIEAHMSSIEVCTGSISDPPSLRRAMTGVTHIIHCAGATKARRNSEFYEINQAGTRNVVEAANAVPGGLQQLLHVSSLAAAGPSSPGKPRREDDPPQPVSAYGKSKLAGELEVQNHCRAPHVILRPPGVYGPRDGEFLRLFRAVQRHLEPRLSARQELSLVFVKDLARCIIGCLDHPGVAGKTYFVASPEVVTARRIAGEIATQMGGWTLPLPLPVAALWPLCLAQEVMTRLTGKTSMLSLQKFAELRARGWVCDPALFRRDTGCECATTLAAGVAETLAWYRQQRWL